MLTYAPYPHRNTALVRALYRTLRAHDIGRDVFAACLQIVMGGYREAITPECAYCDATSGLIPCHDGYTRCEACAYAYDCCKQCGRAPISGGGDGEPDSFAGLCNACRREAWSTYYDDMAIDAYYHGGRG